VSNIANTILKNVTTKQYKIVSSVTILGKTALVRPVSNRVVLALWSDTQHMALQAVLVLELMVQVYSINK